jgi:hypothetical protein
LWIQRYSQAVTEVELPADLRNAVVVLDAPNPDVPGGVTKVYLMGMSHVSKKSVDQVCALQFTSCVAGHPIASETWTAQYKSLNHRR